MIFLALGSNLDSTHGDRFDNINLALVIPTEHPPHIAFTVEDIKDVDHPKYFHRDGSEYCYIKDIDGNTIELISWKKT